LELPTRRIRFIDSGAEALINVSDFDPRLHEDPESPEKPAKAPKPEKPAKAPKE